MSDQGNIKPTKRGRGTDLAAYSIALSLGLAMFASNAQASHFRYGHNTWQRISGNTVEFTSTQAWRSGTDDNLAIAFGDGSFGITAYSTIGSFTDVAGEQYIITQYKVQHTYASEGPYVAYSENCCRISTLVNAADGYERIETIVDLRNGNQGSPVSSIPVIVQMIRGGVNTVSIPKTDPDGDTITCRMATSAESLIPTVATAGGNTLAVSSGCVLTWDTAATAVGQKYAAQVAVEEIHAGNTSRVALDFIIEIIDGSLNQPPTCSGTSGIQVVNVGQSFQGSFTGTDPEAGNLRLDHLGLPSGATLTPAAGTIQASPFSATFHWTPQLADAGSAYAVTVVYTDTGNLTGTCAFSVRVPLCGDGIIDPAASEQCDPSAAPTGCTGTEVCTNSCACTLCGNGMIDVGETCDDSNSVSGDGCDATCQLEGGCGNGIVEVGEDCDPGQSGNDPCCNETTCRHETGGTPCTDDNNVCTDDQCNSAGVCQHTANTMACDDGQFCTDNDMCSGGSCQPGSARDCGVGVACIIASCDEANDVCVTTPDPSQNGQPCDDHDVCTNATSCSAGVCAGGTTLNCNDSSACTADSCDPVSGCVNTIAVESRACASCEDGIDNDSSGDTDDADCGCNLLCESFEYAVIGTRNSSKRTVYMGSGTLVGSVPVASGAGFNSRASVCAERELALIAAATIDGAAAARQNATFGTGTNMHLGFFAGQIPPGVLTTTGNAPFVGSGGLTLTDPANMFPVGSVDLSGTHEEYVDCGLAIQSLVADRDALLSLTPTVELGSYTHGIGGPPIVVSGPGPHVLHIDRLRVRGNSVLEISGDADSVVIFQVDRGFSVSQSAAVQLIGGLQPHNVIWAVNRSGRVYIGSGNEDTILTDEEAAFAGTILAPLRNIVIGTGSRVAGALLGRKVQLNGQVVVSHYPFTAVGP